jgi:putative hydrolase of the HAD superfamily
MPGRHWSDLVTTEPAVVATVFVDADNTLWDTDGVYAVAQLKLLSSVEAILGASTTAQDRLAFVRAIDQGLAERHHSGLRYPPKLLVHALALALAGDPASKAVRRALKTLDPDGGLTADAAEVALAGYFQALKAMPTLRSGVLAGLQRLKALGCLIIVVTEGSRARVSATAQALGLSFAIDRLIEAPKQIRLYQRVARLSRAPHPMFMVGDQLQRDIGPAKAAGLETIYFPGGFAPKWEPAEDVARPHHRIDNFQCAAQIIAHRIVASSNKRLAQAAHIR